MSIELFELGIQILNYHFAFAECCSITIDNPQTWGMQRLTLQIHRQVAIHFTWRASVSTATIDVTVQCHRNDLELSAWKGGCLCQSERYALDSSPSGFEDPLSWLPYLVNRIAGAFCKFYKVMKSQRSISKPSMKSHLSLRRHKRIHSYAFTCYILASDTRQYPRILTTTTLLQDYQDSLALLLAFHKATCSQASRYACFVHSPQVIESRAWKCCTSVGLHIMRFPQPPLAIEV